VEKSLMVLEEGVIEGRRTFANMLKYIKMTASSNFGNVFSVLVASAFLPFLPMLPLHLLIQNLMYDVSQVAIPFDNVDEEQIQKPQRWNPADLGRFMLFFGPISSIFDILTFCVMWFVFKANVPEAQTLFQSGWFVVGLLSQTLIVHMIRTRRIPFIQSRAAWPLIVMTGLVMVMGIALPFSPLAGYLQLQALPLSYFPWLVGILAGYMVLTQMVKVIEAGHVLLDNLGNGIFQRLCRGPRIVGGDTYVRWCQVGILLNRERKNGKGAGQAQQNCQYPGKNGAIDEKIRH
jgi:Mg2+-importing ATPase